MNRQIPIQPASQEIYFGNFDIIELRTAKTLSILALLVFCVFAQPWKSAGEGNLTSETVVTVLNQDREHYGLSPLSTNAKLELAAQAKARHILSNDYFAHISPNGVQPWDFLKAAGIRYEFAGENLAINYTNPYDLEEDFLDSDSHRENLLSPIFSDIGVAVVSGTFQGKPAIITVQMFAKPLKQLSRN